MQRGDARLFVECGLPGFAMFHLMNRFGYGFGYCRSWGATKWRSVRAVLAITRQFGCSAEAFMLPSAAPPGPGQALLIATGVGPAECRPKAEAAEVTRSHLKPGRWRRLPCLSRRIAQSHRHKRRKLRL